MRHLAVVPRFWLLVAVLQRAGGRSSWIPSRAPDRASVVYGNDEEELRQPLGYRRERLDDFVPPRMLEFFADQEARGARRPSSSVVRSFHDQGSSNESTSVTLVLLEDKFLTQQTMCLYFNLSEIPATETTQRAELNLHVEPLASNETSTTLLTVYRATRPLTAADCAMDESATRSGHLRVVARRTVTSRAVGRRPSHGSWATVAVSRAVTRWRRRPEKNFGLVVVWTTVGGPSPVVARRRSYLVTYDNDRDSSPANFLKLIQSRSTSSSSSSSSLTRKANIDTSGDRRRRRHTKRSRRSRGRSRGSRKQRGRKRNLCRRRSMYVDFGEIGWDDWIVAPPGYEAFYCAGDCPFYLPEHLNTTNHAVVQGLIHSVDTRLAPRPCCVPTALSPMSLLYVDNDDNVVLKNYDEMIVEACGCR